MHSVSSRKEVPSASILGNLIDCPLKEIFSGHNFSTIIYPGSVSSSILTDGVSGHNFFPGSVLLETSLVATGSLSPESTLLKTSPDVSEELPRLYLWIVAS